MGTLEGIDLQVYLDMYMCMCVQFFCVYYTCCSIVRLELTLQYHLVPVVTCLRYMYSCNKSTC